MPIRSLLSVLVFLVASPTLAGSVSDQDADLVPDAYDNCLTTANGPNEGSNQLDCDPDGFGDACDADYNNDGGTTTADFGIFFECFTGSFVSVTPDVCACVDPDANGTTTTADFGVFFFYFQTGDAPGPSGLACAGTVPCLP